MLPMPGLAPPAPVTSARAAPRKADIKPDLEIERLRALLVEALGELESLRALLP
jgi:hypothetical protein